MSDLLTEFTRALDCCGTCAGGVLARHVREAQALAWDEGWTLGTDDAWRNGGHRSQSNPYRS